MRLKRGEMKKLKWHIRLFKYIEVIWLGSDKQVSIRRLFAIVFVIDFIRNMHFVIFNWDGSKSYADAAWLLSIEAGLIAALLSLTTYSSTKFRKQGMGNRGYGGYGRERGGGDDINIDVDVNIDDAIDDAINKADNG